MVSWLRSTATVAVLVALVSPGVSAQPAEATAVEGDVPADLAGRWLVVEQNRLPTAMVVPFARLWEIRKGPEHLELVLRRARLPEVVSTKLASGRPWVPDDRDLRELAELWEELREDLPAGVTGAARIDHRLIGTGARHPDRQLEPVTGAGSLVIVTDQRFSGASPVKISRFAYTVRERLAARLLGSFASETTVETPAPVSITLKGDFQAYRLPAVPGRSRLQRLIRTVLGREPP